MGPLSNLPHTPIIGLYVALSYDVENIRLGVVFRACEQVGIDQMTAAPELFYDIRQ